MDESRDIADAISKLAGTHKHDWIDVVWGEVVSVNLNDTDINAPTCVVKGKQDVEYPSVILQGAFSDGFLQVPSVGSQVIIARNIKSPNYFIVMTSDLDALYMQVQGSWLVNWGPAGEDSNFTSKSFGGLVKLVDFNDSNAGILARVNKIEDDINNLKQAFTDWVPSPQDGGAALRAQSASWASQQLIKTQRSDIENPNITHGE